MDLKMFLEKFIDDPHVDRNLNDEEIKEFKTLKDLYMKKMSNNEFDGTFVEFLDKIRKQIEAGVDV